MFYTTLAYRIPTVGLTVLIFCFFTHATITRKSISDFDLGTLFASYDLGSACRSPVHFVMAKRNNTGSCRWKIAENFVKQQIANETELPIADNAGNCLFSCNYLPQEPKMTAELQILSHFSDNPSLRMSDYDLYTYLAPCERTIRGNITEADVNKTKALEKFAGVYFSSDGDHCTGIGQEVLNDAVLRNDSTTGLLAARKNTQVDLGRIQEAIKEIKENKYGLSALRYESEWLYNAVVAYFDQHPQRTS